MFIQLIEFIDEIVSVRWIRPTPLEGGAEIEVTILKIYINERYVFYTMLTLIDKDILKGCS